MDDSIETYLVKRAVGEGAPTPPIDTLALRRVAADAMLSEQAARRLLRGEPTKPATRARFVRSAAALGLLSAFPSLGEVPR